MPSFGLGLSLGSSQPKKSFDPDASAYIINNNIPNSAPVITTNNNYLEFTGSGGYLSVPSNSDLEHSSGEVLTFSFWFKTGSSIPSSSQYWFGKEMEYALRIDSSSQCLFLFGNNGAGAWGAQSSINFGMTLQTNTWYHIVFTIEKINNNSGRVRLYLNGVDRTSGWLTANPYTGTWGPIQNSPFIIGQKMAVIDSQNWRGGIKHFGIWNKELTTSEVSELYNSGSPKSIDACGSSLRGGNLRFYWPFDDVNTSYLRCLNGLSTANTPFTSVSGGSASINDSESTYIYVNPQYQIDSFIKTIKNLNLWSNVVFWPLRNFQVASSGTTFSSLGGLASANLTLNGSGSIRNRNRSVWIGNVDNTATAPISSSNGNVSRSMICVSNYIGNQVIGPGWGTIATTRFSIGRDAIGNTRLDSFDGSGNDSYGSTNNLTEPVFTGVSYNSSNSALYLYANNSVRTSSTLSRTISSQTLMKLNGWGSGNNATGIANWLFVLVSDAPISQSDMAIIYSAYKNTLGVGLGLP